MFRHQGKTRRFGHNLGIASLLSFVAGIVNVAGFFSVQRLTTNVTGHFAFFVDNVFKFNLWEGFVFFLYVFFFFLGAFVSNFLAVLFSRKGHRYVYAVPASVECFILFMLGLWGQRLITISPNTIAFSLLFAMGLQNSLVTKISGSTVRTTHLTGLFTDLGIELSQLFFFKAREQKNALISSIKLRLTIIGFFFTGSITGGILCSEIGLHALILAATTLIFGLVYDNIKLRFILLRRKLKTADKQASNL